MSMVENDGKNIDEISQEPPAHGGDDLLARLDAAFPDVSDNDNMAVPNEDLQGDYVDEKE